MAWIDVVRGRACTNQTAWCQNPEDHGISLNVVENVTLHVFGIYQLVSHSLSSSGCISRALLSID